MVTAGPRYRQLASESVPNAVGLAGRLYSPDRSLDLGRRSGEVEQHMRGMFAPLSPHEEAALRKVGFGGNDPLEPAHSRRLLVLGLIEWAGASWRLTSIGRRRYQLLVQQAAGPDAAA